MGQVSNLSLRGTRIAATSRFRHGLSLARQSLTSPSWLHEARDEPSGAKAIPLTWALCPFKVKHLLAGEGVPDSDHPGQCRTSPAIGHRERRPGRATCRYRREFVLRTARLAASRIVTTPASVGRREGRAIGRERNSDELIRSRLALRRCRPVSTSQSRTVWSLLAVARSGRRARRRASGPCRCGRRAHGRSGSWRRPTGGPVSVPCLPRGERPAVGGEGDRP